MQQANTNQQSLPISLTEQRPLVALDFLGGNCPVQAEGTILGKRFYFRARGEHWSIEIHPTAKGEYTDWPSTQIVNGLASGTWYYDEPYGTWPDAGWMPQKDAVECINRAAKMYQDEMNSL